MPVDLDWGGIDDTKWCGIGIPDRVGQCSRMRGHIDPEHVAHWNSPSSSVHGQWFARWHDGDTVSVKAGQAITLKPTARVPQSVNMYGTKCDCGAGILLTTPIPSGKQCAKCELKAMLATLPRAAPAQPSRCELAESLLKTMVEWDMRSCTVKQQREFLDAIRMLKREAKP